MDFMTDRRVILKPGKEKPLYNRHHWIFSGAISKLPEFTDGECLKVYSANGDMLGWGYFNHKSSIIGRMVSFDETLPKEAILSHLESAATMRFSFFDQEKTNSYRLVNGEGDLLPGLVIDRYRDVFVLQVSTLGMQQFLPLIVDWIIKKFSPKSIYEKSLLPSRKDEGLQDEQRTLFGEVPANSLEIRENGLDFYVSVLHGQKTGFFLDHRETREQVRSLSNDKKVLNCFAYTGGFSIYAAAGGAKAVDSVDISAAAVQMAERNMQLNGLTSSVHHFFAADVFDFLRNQPLDYNLVILDPPAFAKRQKDVVSACRGYKDINRLAMEKMPKDSILLTSSCSYHVDEKLFQTVVFQAAIEAKRIVKIIGRHRAASDHPINICHPESDYLKSLILWID
jgi:23S rRNA (cytosine1962-C5)-methyltransferase